LVVFIASDAGVATSPSTISPPTAGPVITIVGGLNAPVNAVGSHNDSSDLYGIVIVLVVIVVAIAAARWIFGRGGRGLQSSGER
jgi:hypothetical protein